MGDRTWRPQASRSTSLPTKHSSSSSFSRYSDSDRLEIIDQAEQRALWNICCLLEKELAEPFDPAYLALLSAARDRLRDPV